MQGNGNGIKTLLRKLYFMVLPTSGRRTRYIIKHASLFRHIGNGLFYQPRTFPSDPEFISFGNNVNIASNVSFINHDIIGAMLNKKFEGKVKYGSMYGPISIGDNVMIGAHSIILPNVKIGDNVIIGAGSVVSKDIPSNSVAAGVPARVIKDFDSFVMSRDQQGTSGLGIEEIWDRFEKSRIR